MASIALIALVVLSVATWRTLLVKGRMGSTSNGVALLNRALDVRWGPGVSSPPRLGAPLEAGRLSIQSGMIQLVFYSGARMVIEGPAELNLVSSGEAECRLGRLLVEVPPQAHGFRVQTPRMNVKDLGTEFGMSVNKDTCALHVFKGSVDLSTGETKAARNLVAGSGAEADQGASLRTIAADPVVFASLYDLQRKSTEAAALRYDRWREASRRLHLDASLLVHFDFEHSSATDWQLRNASRRTDLVSDAAIVGCQWVEGRWQGKPALEFRGVSDRVRMNVPGEYESITLAAWVRVQGLDRQLNAVFMSDGFEPGTLHWLIRTDGVLGLTVVGRKPGSFQIVASPPVVSLDQFGMWLHLGVVADGKAGEVRHYFNGREVDRQRLNQPPPYRIGFAELGNWNTKGSKENDPLMIRNFSGSMDELCVFGRALKPAEILALYQDGKPSGDSEQR